MSQVQRQWRANERSRLRLDVVHCAVIDCEPRDYRALVWSVLTSLLWNISARSLICQFYIALHSAHWRPLKRTACLFSFTTELRETVLSCSVKS